MIRRSPLRRVGSVAKRYAKARQAFLKNRYEAVMVCTFGQVSGDGGHAQVKCECGTECGQYIPVVLMDGFYRTLGHVDHIQKRSTHPGLRNELSNLRLLTPACHMRRHHDAMR